MNDQFQLMREMLEALTASNRHGWEPSPAASPAIWETAATAKIAETPGGVLQKGTLQESALGEAVSRLRTELAFTDNFYRRLHKVLQNSAAAGERDIVALVRQLLRREQEHQGGVAQLLRMPAHTPWPSKTSWEEAGVKVLQEQTGCYTLQARRWQPDWLPGAATFPPEKNSFRETTRRFIQQVEGDPFLALAGFSHYLCAGQREVVRAVLTAPPGSTLLAILPTAAGKSLAAHLPSLFDDPQVSGITVVVVPTTSLCIDQERALADRLPYPTAYYSAVTTDDQERNREIRQRIRDGTQRIVFTSPESLMQSLAASVYQAARRGYLRMLVVDEAHMVDQWGDEFRSAFQEIAGLRQDLLRSCQGSPPFRTLLLSATVTESCLDTLETLFGRPGPFEIISAVQLRPEPSIWHVFCHDEETKESRVLEAIHHLPRPLILYVSKIAHAEQWLARLQQLGYRRCEVVTGNTGTTERNRIIGQWRRAETDMIVANSAFGLGVDQANVRAIVHACVPENVDRYYQEVGRAGRDGKACLALMVYTEEDLNLAFALNRKTYIGSERGRERWSSMFAAKETLAPGRYRVRLDLPPTMLPRDIDMDNDQSIAWSIRTLTLMSRAGLLELDGEAPPWLNESETGNGAEQDYEQMYRVRKNTRIVRVLNESHLREDTWLEVVEPARQRSKDMNQQGFALMQEVLSGKRCVGEILAEVYTIEARNQPPRRSVPVSYSCGGCPYCREQGRGVRVGPMPVPRPVWKVQSPLGQELVRLFGAHRQFAVFYDPFSRSRNQQRLMERLLRWFVAQGVQNLVIPLSMRPAYADLLQNLSSEIVFLHEAYEPLLMPCLPSLILHPASEPIPLRYYRPVPGPDGVPRILVLPHNLLDPERDQVALRTTISCNTYLVPELITEVGL